MAKKKKGIQKMFAVWILCMHMTGCGGSAETENTSATELSDSKVDPLEEVQSIELGNIQIQIPADWEFQQDQSEENQLIYSGKYNDVFMYVSMKFKEGESSGVVPEEDREAGITYLNELLAELDDDSDGQTFIDADIWERGSNGQMIYEANYSLDDDESDALLRNMRIFNINYGEDTYLISFVSGECESEDMDFWEDIIRNISYTELDAEASTTSETEVLEESSPAVIAIEPDPEEMEEEIIESNPTIAAESTDVTESAEWNPEYTLGSIYYSPGKFAFAILDFKRLDVESRTVYPYYDEVYSLGYVYTDYNNEVDFLDGSVEIKVIRGTHHPDLPDIRDGRTIYDNSEKFFDAVPEPESYVMIPESVGIYSVEGAIEIKVTFTTYDETVTYYLPQNYSYKDED